MGPISSSLVCFLFWIQSSINGKPLINFACRELMITVGPPEGEVDVRLGIIHFGEVNAPPVRHGIVVVVPALVVVSSVRKGAEELSTL